MSVNPLHATYRPDIDGLRAIAVLSVVLFHGFPQIFKGGFIGVDVFFVLSGYLISRIIFDQLNQGTFNFFDFYARRIKRIFPALLVVLFAAYIAGWFILLADEYGQLGQHIAYPAQTGRSSHRKLISDPTANWTVIPGQPDHFGA